MYRQSMFRRMLARRPDEPHRASTPLELLFDLCFVVAVARASNRLQHALSLHHNGSGVLDYVMVFFAIWWAWMNFTWFASAYDTDDAAYRVTTAVQIAGALVLAAGVPRAFDRLDFSVITAGYVVMRLAMVSQWLRAAHDDREHRPAALRFAVGIAVVQVGWVLRLLLPGGLGLAAFAVLAVCELLVPVVAERAARTTWHPEHIAERYGCFTLIVLGEAVLGASTAIGSALDAGHGTGDLLAIASAGLVIVFCLWWLYFDRPVHDLLTSLPVAMTWGYGHLVIFASVAAVGTGIELTVDASTEQGSESATAAGVAGWSIAIAVGLFLLGIWALHIRPRAREYRSVIIAIPVAVVLMLLAPLTHAAIFVVAGLLVVLVVMTVAANARATSPP